MSFPALILCAAILIPSLVWAAPQSMPPKDLALLIRSGIPKADMLTELTKRRLAAPPPAGETILAASGATPTLITEIKNGNYALSEAQAAVLEKQAVAARSAAAQAASTAAANSPKTPIPRCKAGLRPTSLNSPATTCRIALPAI